MPWLQIITGAISGVAAIDKASKRRDAEDELENMSTPTYTRNQSILDFYNTALQKYKTHPTETAEYKAGKQEINRGTIQGLKSLQDRRSALAGTPTLIAGQNNSLLKLAARAEQDKSRQASIVSQAAGPAQAELEREFRYNQVGPFEKKYNLLALKAANLAKSQNMSEQNAYGNLSSGITGLSSFGK